MSYWVIAVPKVGDPLRKLQSSLGTTATCFPFRVPKLKVGTMDSLMALSDDLSKADNQVEAVAKKLSRSFAEVVKNRPQSEAEAAAARKSKKGRRHQADEPQLTAKDNLPPAEYIQNFEWDLTQHRIRSPIKTLLDKNVADTLKADEDIRNALAKYNEVRTTIDAIERKETGTLLVKPLGKLVPKSAVLETDSMTTVIIVVPTEKEEDFMAGYEYFEREERDRQAQFAKMAHSQRSEPAEDEEEDIDEEDEQAQEKREARAQREKQLAKRKELNALCDSVVPGSAQKLASGKEYALYRVIVLRKGVELYKNLCRQRQFTVRAFEYNPDEEKNLRAQKATLDGQRAELWNYLVQLCTVNYAAVFSAWSHIKAMRLFVEAVLRYGLPVNFAGCLILPRHGQEQKARKTLALLYADLASQDVVGDASDKMPGGTAGEEFYSYVSLNMTINHHNK